jgi:hypothetical protein
LLGWAEELQTVRKECQEAEMILTELQNKYRAAKKTGESYKLWADRKELHMEQEWKRIGVGLWNGLQVVQDKAQDAVIDNTVTDSAIVMICEFV